MDNPRSQALGTKLRPSREFTALTLASVAAGLIWFSVWSFLPEAPRVAYVADRLAIALKCFAVAVTFTLMLGVEAVGHERLMTPAFDPLAGHDSRGLTINNRFIQNTLEQLMAFAVGLIGLAIYCDGPSATRAIVAATIVWITARWAFWIGYHLGSQHRVAGLVGVAQSLVLSLWTCFHVGKEFAGVTGGVALVGLFGLAELTIVIGLRRKPGFLNAADATS